jgi:hypothetical protein
MKFLIICVVLAVLVILTCCTENAPVKINFSGDIRTGSTITAYIVPIHLPSIDTPSITASAIKDWATSVTNEISNKITDFTNKFIKG